jgi:hypothetical protein
MPFTSQQDEQLRALHAEGVGCNEIARRMNVTNKDVSLRAKALGLPFDRRQTAVATKARTEEARARRVDIIHRLYDRAEALLARLEADSFTTLVPCGPGEQEPRDLHFVPPSDERYLASAMTAHLASALKLEQHDADRARDTELAAQAIGLGKAIANAVAQAADDTGG